MFGAVGGSLFVVILTVAACLIWRKKAARSSISIKDGDPNEIDHKSQGKYELSERRTTFKSTDELVCMEEQKQ